MSEARRSASQPVEKLLHTKLMPPHLHANLLPRPELLARLDVTLARKLTLVMAPTGFGKTTLVRMWIGARDFPSAWVTLDENDNDPVRFWTYVTTALRNLDSSVGRAMLAALSSSQPPALSTVLTLLINELSRLSRPCVLVLEDYHVISVAEIHATVSFLLQHLPDTLHLVLLSRTAPELPLGILRARDDLVEIDAASLRFSLPETQAFLRETLPMALPAAALARLQERTEGWAAGLRLVALALQSRRYSEETEQFIQEFSGGHRYVADYLIQEVFEGQSQAVQAFLLQTCFLNRLTGSLCDSITEGGDGASVLEQLERENLFLVRLEHTGERVWYRYSPLFAESMQTLARQRLGEAGVRSVFEKASAWYEYQQLYDDAIETALRAGLFERAMALIETFTKIYSLSEMYTLNRWMERIPTPLVLQHPQVCLVYAQVLLFTLDRFSPATAARMEPFLNAAQESWQADENEAGVGAVLALRGMMLLWQGDFQKASDCVYQSLEKLPEQDVFWRGISLLNAAAAELQGGQIVSAQDRILEGRALLGASQNMHGLLAATQMMAELFYLQGDHEQAVQISEQIIADAVGDDSMLDDQGTAHLTLANVAYEQNDLETAEEHARQALDFGEQRANEVLWAAATVRLAAIWAARGEMEKGQEMLKSLSARLQNPVALRDIQDAQAWLAFRAAAPESLDGEWTLIPEGDAPIFFLRKEQQAFLLARLRIAEGAPSEALRLLQPYLADAARQGRARSQVMALCLTALAHQAAGASIEAGQTLAQALSIGREKDFRRLFLDEGRLLAGLLQDVLPRLSKRSLSLYTTTLLHLFPAEMLASLRPLSDSSALVEPLSGQEMRVLRLLVAGLSNAEIAQELVVSINTIKTHVKSIYRKLNVKSRDEAREAAQELKLV